MCIVLVWTPCSKHWLTRFKPFLKYWLLVLTPAPLSLDIEPSQWVLCKEHSTRESSICLLSVPDMLCVSPHHWPLIMMYNVCCIYWAELGAKIQTKWRKIISILSLIRESWMIELFFLSPICLQLKSISGTINWNPEPHHNPQSQIYS